MSQQSPVPQKAPTPHYPPQAFSPPPAVHPSNAPPPAKRQRLSPDARSPGPVYGNGTYQSHQATQPGVTSGYGNPYAQGTATTPQAYSPQYAGSPVQQYSPSSFNTPQSYQANRQPWQSQQRASQQQQQRAQNAASPQGRDMMPPPPRPNREDNNEKFGVDDVNDALFSSGINLKDEENYIHNTFANRHSGTESFSSNQNASFGSSSMSQGGSFNLLTQGTSFSSQPNATGTGTLGAAASQENVEDEVKHLRVQAARSKAEADQHHLKNPFLLGNVLRLRMERIARENGVKLDVNGMYVLKPQAKVRLNGDNTEGVVQAMAGSVIDAGVPFAEALSLISLAAAERVRGLLDESHAMARARRYADYGRVPVEFSDVAVGEGTAVEVKVVPESITGTPWDQPADGTSDKPLTTVAFQSAVNQQLRSIAKRAEEAEEARLKRRAARRKAAEAALNNEDTPMSNAGDTADSTATPGPDAGTPQAKITKKELVRQQKEKASLSEAQAATTTNQTAAMMALGKKGNRYSWMSGGAASMPTNRFAKPATSSAPLSGSGTPSRKDGSRTPAGSKKGDANGKSKANGLAWGEWRENSAAGRGIQVRDWLSVLERDGREKQALEKTQLRLGLPIVPKPEQSSQGPSPPQPLQQSQVPQPSRVSTPAQSSQAQTPQQVQAQQPAQPPQQAQVPASAQSSQATQSTQAAQASQATPTPQAVVTT